MQGKLYYLGLLYNSYVAENSRGGGGGGGTHLDTQGVVLCFCRF